MFTSDSKAHLLADIVSAVLKHMLTPEIENISGSVGNG